MLSKIKFTKKEIKHLLISIIVLGFVFGFDDGSDTFILSRWLLNLIRILIVVAASMLVKTIGHKIAAIKLGASAEYEIWSISKLGLSKARQFPLKLAGFLNLKIKSLPLGIILPLFFVLSSAIFTSNKYFFPFAATGIIALTAKKAHRLGKRFVNLTEIEEAKIYFTGLLFSLLLILIIKIIMDLTTLNLTSFITINSYIILFNMLPIPPLDGGKIFFTSIVFYVFSALFLLFSILLIQHLSIISTILLALLFSGLLTAIFHLMKNY